MPSQNEIDHNATQDLLALTAQELQEVHHELTESHRRRQELQDQLNVQRAELTTQQRESKALRDTLDKLQGAHVCLMADHDDMLANARAAQAKLTEQVGEADRRTELFKDTVQVFADMAERLMPIVRELSK